LLGIEDTGVVEVIGSWTLVMFAPPDESRNRDRLRNAKNTASNANKFT